MGATQGFTSFTPSSGGGLRIFMLNNRVNLSYSQGIACYNCVDSVFSGNMLTTIPGSDHQTRINIVGGRNNIISNNSIGNFVRPLKSNVLLSTADQTAFDDLGASTANWADWGWDATASTPLSAAALAAFAINASVPEPGTWLQLLAGMMAIGWVARRRQGSVAA